MHEEKTEIFILFCDIDGDIFLTIEILVPTISDYVREGEGEGEKSWPLRRKPRN